MMTKTCSWLLVALTSLAAPTAAGDSNSGWTKLELGNLFVLMPGTAKKKVIHDRSFIGDIETREYYVNDGRDVYSIELSDLPGFAVAFSGRETIYDHARGALLKKTLSKFNSFSDVTLNGVKGKRLVYDTPTRPGHPEMQGEARFFLVGHRLYVVDAVVEMDGGGRKLSRFFSSLQISK